LVTGHLCSAYLHYNSSIRGSVGRTIFDAKVQHQQCAGKLDCHEPIFWLLLRYPFLGWLSDYIKRRKFIMVITTIGALISLTLFVYLPVIDSKLLDAILLFAVGLFSGGFLISFAAGKESSEIENVATTMGFMNTINNAGGALFQPFIGIVLSLLWQGQLVNGAHVYSVHAYKLALTSLPVCMLLAS